MNLKHIIFLEAFVIVVLLSAIVALSSKNANSVEKAKESNGLLSPRVYAGLLEPQSYLIFNFDPLREKISQFIENNHLNVSVYVENLRDGASMGINEDQSYFPASLNKLLVAMIILKKIERNELSFNTMVPVVAENKDPAFGVLYTTNAAALPLRVVLESMLRESDNTAFMMLQRYVEPEDLTFLVHYLDYYEGKYSVVDSTSARSVTNIFSSLYLSTVLEPQDSEYILQNLVNTTFDIKEIAGLPADTRIAHKFGVRYDSVSTPEFHDCGIMYIGQLDRTRLTYCVMTKGLPYGSAEKAVGLIVHEIYNYTTAVRSQLHTHRQDDITRV